MKLEYTNFHVIHRTKRAADTHTQNPHSLRALPSPTLVELYRLPFQAFSPFQVLASSVPVTERRRPLVQLHLTLLLASCREQRSGAPEPAELPALHPPSRPRAQTPHAPHAHTRWDSLPCSMLPARLSVGASREESVADLGDVLVLLRPVLLAAQKRCRLSPMLSLFLLAC